MCAAHAKLELEPRMCVSLNVSQRKNVTCEVCCSHTRRLQQIAVSSKRNDYNKKFLQSVTSEQLSEETAQRSSPFYDAALSRTQMCLTLMNFMNSTRNRSSATIMCWMKKTTDAIFDTARRNR